MRVLDGTYEMAVGYGAGEKEPPMAARILLPASSEYEMTDPDSWHYVRPIDRPTMSFMIVGKPWDRPAPKVGKVLNPLTETQKEAILTFFREYYGGKKSR